MQTIKKILYYRDAGLLWKAFLTSIKISFISFIKDSQSVIASIPPINTKVIKKADRNKISKYINLCVFIRRKLGIRDTCFTRSILLCHMLRRAGIGANVNFGARKIDGELVGHCWVTPPNESESVADYKTIFRYPQGGR